MEEEKQIIYRRQRNGQDLESGGMPLPPGESKTDDFEVLLRDIEDPDSYQPIPGREEKADVFVLYVRSTAGFYDLDAEVTRWHDRVVARFPYEGILAGAGLLKLARMADDFNVTAGEGRKGVVELAVITHEFRPRKEG